jgi:N-acetylglutamate synthase-like GNAT family acetyltransferase
VIEIREVTFAEIAHLKRAAGADRVLLSGDQGRRWFAAFDDNARPVGTAALRFSKSGARICGVWVAPAWRGRGVGDSFTERLIAECRGKVAAVDAFAFNPAYYTAKGFKIVGKQTSAGATRVRLQLAVRAKTVTKSALWRAASRRLPPDSD